MPSGPTTRKRDLPFKLKGGYVTHDYRNEPDIVYPEWSWEMKGTQITVSEGHPWPPRKGTLEGDIGGDFSTKKSYASYPRRVVYVETPWWGSRRPSRYTYQGPILPIHPMYMPFPPDLSPTEEVIDELGATAVARCKPTNSVADASVFLGELLKDGIPSLVGIKSWKDRTNPARGVSDEFLNYQFGWKQILMEANKFLDGVRRASTVLEQFERDSGRVVRRKYSFPLKKETTEERILPTYNILTRPWYGDTSVSTLDEQFPLGEIWRTRKTVQRQWFSGAFTYHMPTKGSKARSRMDKYAQMAEHVFGLKLTPEVLWNISPWSWAVDWVSNAGDVLSNVTDHKDYGLVLRYGYMMVHTITVDTYTFRRTDPASPAGPLPLPVVLTTESKVRRKANPFGFGVTWEGLSPIQTAIAAALGISRSR